MAPRLSGYVKIHRKLIEWGWYQDHAVKDVFLHLLITASYKESEWMGHKIKPGQVIVGSSQMARDLGLSRQQVRTALIKLESTGEITKASTNRFTIVTVENWAEYQIIEDEATNKQPALSAENELSENFFGKNQPAVRVETPIHTGVHATNKQPTSNQQATNKQPHLKKVKNNKNVKNNKGIYGEYKNVLLTDEEYLKVQNEFPDYADRIERLSEYIASTGKVYKSHIATIRSWARKDSKAKSEQKGTDWLDLNF